MTSESPTPTGRLVSLDAYRGFIMLAMVTGGLGMAGLRNDNTWGWLAHQLEHVKWEERCTFWDLIQPSFMFMVGVAMAFSYAKRRQLGHSYPRMLLHAVWRSVALVVLGIFLISNNAAHTEWSLMNVLSQIGLGYTFLFLLWGCSFRTQAVAAAAILVGTWLLYVLYPGAGIEIPEGTDAWPAGREWAQLLWDAGAAALAVDNPAVDAMPAERGAPSLHSDVLPLLGLPLGELVDLEELSTACAAEERWEFLFLAVPLLVPGGMGSPANAVAVL